jgi:hypothetical protein
MSHFLGNIGQITEWVVVSNLENRALNAGINKAQGWWHDRKQHKHDRQPGSNTPTPPPPSQSQTKYPALSPQYPPQQASYMPPPQQASYMPPPPPPSMGSGQLLITVNHVEGLNQRGPLIVVIECNYQRYQIPFSQFQQQFTFPINQIDYDQFLVWIQTEHQQQTVAHGEIPVRVLLNNNQWNSQQKQQRWIPLRDHYNGPAGQILISAEYRGNYSPGQQGPEPPPPYPYYS